MSETIDVNPGDRPPKPEGTQKPVWGRRVLTVLVALAAVGGFTAVVIYSYDSGNVPSAGTGAPVITAQKGPTKIRPKDPGGMAVPDRDKQVYGRLNAAEKPAQAERLLPPPEIVMNKPSAESSAKQMAAMTEREMEKAAKRLSAIAPAARSPASMDIPPPPPSAIAPPPRMAASQPKKTAKEAIVAPRQVAKLGKAPMKSSASSYRIQIASLRSQGDAKKAWGRLTKKHKDLFGKLQSNIVRVDLKGKGTFYRLQAGPLADRPSAKTLCSRLKKRKIGCLVVKP
ncbi:MAG: SPOR domain-containing protein [Rhodospirillaceae bacterium]|jgi:hypothetical protein|nr:SPOR domain-containing protein [Rhodospirillaceae bacterium]MBT5456489.1 SPOR domain-containing protein [Rhodospirillaceae bacterium]